MLSNNFTDNGKDNSTKIDTDNRTKIDIFTDYRKASKRRKEHRKRMESKSMLDKLVEVF